eukprot:7256353-Pyramimonas_sp.AAC.1
MEGGSFPKCGSRLSAAHIRFQHLQEFRGLRAVMLIRGVEVPNMALGRGSGSSRRSSQVDAWR